MRNIFFSGALAYHNLVIKLTLEEDEQALLSMQRELDDFVMSARSS